MRVFFSSDVYVFSTLSCLFSAHAPTTTKVALNVCACRFYAANYRFLFLRVVIAVFTQRISRIL